MFRNKFFDFFAKYFDAFETLFIVCLTVSLYLLYQVTPYSQYGVYASLGLLAFLYWVMGIRPFTEKVAGIRIAIRRIVYIAYLLSSLSFLASLRFDNEVDPLPLIIASLSFLGVAVLLLLIKRFKLGEKTKFVSHIIRCVIFTTILVWLLVMFN